MAGCATFASNRKMKETKTLFCGVALKFTASLELHGYKFQKVENRFHSFTSHLHGLFY